jgi:DNA-binding transcriptional LysR family regulator
MILAKLRPMEVFAAVVEVGNFTDAANGEMAEDFL